MGFLGWSLTLSTLLDSFVICSFRAKYHKLKFGTDLNQGEKKADLSEQGTRPCILPTSPPPALQLLGIEKLQMACTFFLCSVKSSSGHRARVGWSCILSVSSHHQSCVRHSAQHYLSAILLSSGT